MAAATVVHSPTARTHGQQRQQHYGCESQSYGQQSYGGGSYSGGDRFFLRGNDIDGGRILAFR
jgi:hypothetical protein